MTSCASRLAALSLLLGAPALAQQVQLTKICDANASPPQCASVAADGTLKTTAGGGGGGSDTASSATGAAVPTSANYTGFNSGGNLVGVSSAAPLPVSQQGTVGVTQSGSWSMLQSGSWSMTLLAGSALVGGVEIYDASGVNKLSVDASGRLTVLQGGGAWSVTQSGTWTVQQGTPPWSVSQSGAWTVAATESGTWTVQPGNTANTTAWLVTGTGGTFPVTGSVSVSNFPAVQPTQDFDAGVSLAQVVAQLATVQTQLAAIEVQQAEGLKPVVVPPARALDGTALVTVRGITQPVPVQPVIATLDGGTAAVTGTVTANAGMGPFIAGGPVSSGTAPSPTLDNGFPVSATLNRVNTRTLTSVAFSTGGAGRVLVVAVTFAAGGTTVYPVTISDAAGLTWVKQVENIESPNVAGSAIWTAYSASTLINDTVTATNSSSVLLSGEFSVYSFANASQTVGSKGGRSWVSGAALPVDSTALSVQAGSWVIAAFTDGNTGVGLPGTTLSTTTFDATSQDPGNGNSFGTAHSTVASTTSGTLTIGTNGSDTFLQTAAIELQAAAYPVLVAGVYNTTQPSLANGQVAQVQSAQRGGLVVATGTDPFYPSQASNSLPWNDVTNVVLQPLNPLLQRCNAVRRSNCQP